MVPLCESLKFEKQISQSFTLSFEQDLWTKGTHDFTLAEVDITLSKQRRAANDETVSPVSWPGAPPLLIRHCVLRRFFLFSRPLLWFRLFRTRWNGILNNGDIFRNFFFYFDDELFEYLMYNNNNLCHDHWT